MNVTKTLRAAQPTFSEGKAIDFKVPESWRELTQDQLRYVLYLMTTFPAAMAKTYMFFRFTGTGVLGKNRNGWKCLAAGKVFYISAAQVESLIHVFDFIDSYENMGVRLDDAGGYHAVDADLNQLRFLEYLNAEKYYQLYHMRQVKHFADRLACILYRKTDGSQPVSISLTEGERMGVVLWFAWVKDVLAKRFPHFFRRVVGTGQDMDGTDIVQMMDVQIRALTDGDITKEAQVLEMPYMRALTELDFKAKEAQEFNEKYNNSSS